MKSKYQDYANKIRKSIQENENEWSSTYQGYINAINDPKSKEQFELLAKESEGIISPLQRYTCIGYLIGCLKGNPVKLDVRYLGQTIAELWLKYKRKMGPFFRADLHAKDTVRCFGIDHSTYPCKKLDDSTVIEFIDWFNQKKPRLPSDGEKIKKRNEEHRIESLLISTLLEKDSLIEPVTLSGVRFAMTTPISASNKNNVHYSCKAHAGIDILARYKRNSPTELCVIELKDETPDVKKPEDVVKQAIAYAIFIRELLRSRSGTEWWKLFGFKTPLPEEIVINAVCAMPRGKKQPLPYDKNPIKIGRDKIIPHDCYFNEENDKISIVSTSLRV